MSKEPLAHALILMNGTGDVAVTWNDPHDMEVLTFIQRKIDAGFVFFIMEKRFFKLTERRKRLENVNDIPKNRVVYLDDEEAERAVLSGKMKVTKLEPGQTLKGVRRAKDAADVAGNQSFGTRPKFAG